MNQMPQKKKRRLQSMQVNQREKIENETLQEKERRLQCIQVNQRGKIEN